MRRPALRSGAVPGCRHACRGGPSAHRLKRSRFPSAGRRQCPCLLRSPRKKPCRSSRSGLCRVRTFPAWRRMLSVVLRAQRGSTDGPTTVSDCQGDGSVTDDGGAAPAAVPSGAGPLGTVRWSHASLLCLFRRVGSIQAGRTSRHSLGRRRMRFAADEGSLRPLPRMVKTGSDRVTKRDRQTISRFRDGTPRLFFRQAGMKRRPRSVYAV